MRLLHIISTLDPASGGPSEGVRLLLSYQAIGYRGEVVTLDAPDAPFLQGLPFRVHALGRVPTTYGFSLKLYRFLRDNRTNYDGFIVNGLWQFCGLATFLAIGQHQPYVVFTHGMLDPWFKREYPWKHVKKLPYWYGAEFWILRRAFRVLFTTETEASLARQSFAFFRWRSIVVPYGILERPRSTDADIRAFHQKCPQLRERRFLLFLGRIHTKKGCDLLIQSFSELAGRDEGLDLVMAGPDQQGWVPHLQQMAATYGCAARIHWPGMLKGGAKWGAFDAAEAFILPSHQENFGIAVAEALSCRTPVLISDQVNIFREIAEDGCGYVAPDTLAGTKDLIGRWIATPPEIRERMREQAYLTFRARYDMQRSAQTIIQLFQDVTRVSPKLD